MKSTFFHIGVNRSMAAKWKGLQEPQIQENGSIPYVALPDHADPDFEGFTYGDPFGRLRRLLMEDIVWFIESGTKGNDWGYYLVAFFSVEAVYSFPSVLSKHIDQAHRDRIMRNAHYLRGDWSYDIVLGSTNNSRLLFEDPLKISERQDPFKVFKECMELPQEPLKGYWFKKWFGDGPTRWLLAVVTAAQPRPPRRLKRFTL